LTNLAPLKGKDLKEMRAIYDAAVEAWRRDGVDYNGYEPYGDIFDRSIPWKSAKPQPAPKKEPKKPKKKDGRKLKSLPQ
jgi:hypothetical protein